MTFLQKFMAAQSQLDFPHKENQCILSTILITRSRGDGCLEDDALPNAGGLFF
jgi:hypothetical protein